VAPSVLLSLLLSLPLSLSVWARTLFDTIASVMHTQPLCAVGVVREGWATLSGSSGDAASPPPPSSSAPPRKGWRGTTSAPTPAAAHARTIRVIEITVPLHFAGCDWAPTSLTAPPLPPRPTGETARPTPDRYGHARILGCVYGAVPPQRSFMTWRVCVRC
jgi:hypothetical protein